MSLFQVRTHKNISIEMTPSLRELVFTARGTPHAGCIQDEGFASQQGLTFQADEMLFVPGKAFSLQVVIRKYHL